MSKATDISKINEHSPYYDMTPGNQIYGGGGSRKFCTGEWRTKTPVIDWEKCTQCLLCTPVCPDSCIPVKDGKREDFDLDHCKGWYPLEEKPNAKILVLRYLTEGGAAPSTGKFLTYREIPWGEVYFKQFQGRCLFRLAFGFGGKLDKFREIMERVGAQAISSGDVGYELEFMKGLFVRLILWAGDDEFPPSAQILFSDNFPAAFTQGEDMAVVGDVTMDMLKALAAK